ncbi:uncharacterized protein LOC144462773 isoform X2 [Epinephelus lanceolatus]
MAARQSSPPCAPLTLLLLLIGVISCHLPEVQARPTDFWCNPQARKTMERKTEGLRKDMAACVGENTLPSPVQLPCVSINTTEWANKTLRQKHAEVVEALQVFQDGVQGAKDQTTSGCLTSLLEKLEHHITNYLAIVSSVQIQDDTVTPSQSAAQNCSSSSSTNEVLKQYENLLQGKLERFVADLRKDISKTEPRTNNTKEACS